MFGRGLALLRAALMTGVALAASLLRPEPLPTYDALGHPPAAVPSG